jgi:hypothetical protein
MSLYLVLASGALAGVLLTYALVREVRLRRALVRLITLVLKRQRRSHGVQTPARDDHAGSGAARLP